MTEPIDAGELELSLRAETSEFLRDITNASKKAADQISSDLQKAVNSTASSQNEVVQGLDKELQKRQQLLDNKKQSLGVELDSQKAQLDSLKIEQEKLKAERQYNEQLARRIQGQEEAIASTEQELDILRSLEKSAKNLNELRQGGRSTNNLGFDGLLNTQKELVNNQNYLNKLAESETNYTKNRNSALQQTADIYKEINNILAQSAEYSKKIKDQTDVGTLKAQASRDISSGLLGGGAGSQADRNLKQGKALEALQLQQRLNQEAERYNKLLEQAETKHKRRVSLLSQLGQSTAVISQAEEEHVRHVEKLNTEYQQVQTHLKNLSAEQVKNLEATARKAKSEASTLKFFFREIGEGLANQIGSLLTSIITSPINMAIGLLQSAVRGVIGQISASLDAFKNYESLKVTVNIASQGQGAEAFSFLEKAAAKYKVQLDVLAESYKGFVASSLAAGNNLAETNYIFERLVMTGRALGLSNEDVKGSLEAVSQMFSKGKIQAEELRGQLGDRFPGALANMAAAIGVTTQELDKMLQKGQLTPDSLFALAKKLEEQYGSKLPEALKTTTATAADLQNQVIRLQKDFGESINPFNQAAMEAASEILENISRGAFTQIRQRSEEIRDYLRQNPQIVQTISDKISQLLTNGLNRVADKAKEFLEYLKNNPKAIDEGVEKAGQLVELFTKLADLGGRFANWIVQAAEKMDQFMAIPGVKEFIFGAPTIDMNKGALGMGGGIPVEAPTGPTSSESYVTNTIPGRQGYGDARSGGRRHAGVDFDIGSDGKAITFAGGVVSRVGHDPGGYGHYVDVFNAATRLTERIAEMAQVVVKEGQRVAPGQVVGQGESSTGVIHFEVRTDGNANGAGSGFNGSINPLDYLKNNGLADVSSGSGGTINIKPKQIMGPAPHATGSQSAPAAREQPVVEMYRTGQKDASGLEKLLIRVVDKNGKVLQQAYVNSGLPSTQDKFLGSGQGIADRGYPLEFGNYSIGQTFDERGNPGMRSNFVEIDPKFQTQRSQLGIHLDGDRSTKAGSEGCIVFTSAEEFKAFQDAVRASGASELKFTDGKNLTQRALANSGGMLTTLPDSRTAPPISIQQNRNIDGYMSRIAFLESTFNTGAYNARSGAAGAFQFTPATVSDALGAGLPDPTKGSLEEQGRAAWLFIQKFHPDAASAIKAGNFSRADQLLKGRWSALPGGGEPQDSARMAQANSYLPGGGNTPKLSIGASTIKDEDIKPGASAEDLYKQAVSEAKKYQDASKKARRDQEDAQLKQIREERNNQIALAQAEASQSEVGKRILANQVELLRIKEKQTDATKESDRAILDQEEALTRLKSEPLQFGENQAARDNAIKAQENLIKTLKANRDRIVKTYADQLAAKETEYSKAAESELQKLRDERAQLSLASDNNRRMAWNELASSSPFLNSYDRTRLQIQQDNENNAAESRSKRLPLEQERDRLVKELAALDAGIAKLPKEMQEAAKNDPGYQLLLGKLIILGDKIAAVDANAGIKNRVNENKNLANDMAQAKAIRSANNSADDELTSQVEQNYRSSLEARGNSDLDITTKVNALSRSNTITKINRDLEESIEALKESGTWTQELEDKLRSIAAIKIDNLKFQFKDLGAIIRDELNGQFKTFFSGLDNSFKSFFQDIISGNKSIGDSFRSLFSSILSQLAQLAVNRLWTQLLGGKGSGGIFQKPTESGFSGILGLGASLIGAFGGGGGGLANAFTGASNYETASGFSIPAFAEGGVVQGRAGGGLAILGDNSSGYEAVVPLGSSKAIGVEFKNKNALATSNSNAKVEVTINNNGSSQISGSAGGPLGKNIQQAVEGVLVQHLRPNGMINRAIRSA